MLRHALASVATLAVFTVATEADAQGINLNQLDPGLPGDAFFSLPSPWTHGHLTPAASLGVDYLRRPLTLDGLPDEAADAVVSDLFFLRVGASLALVDRVTLNAEMPFAVLQSGDDPSANGVTVSSPDAARAGDLRFGMRIRIFGEYDEPLQLGVGFNGYFPTAGGGTYVGDEGVGVRPHIIVGGNSRWLTYTATVGFHTSSASSPPKLTYGLGAGVLLLDDMLQIGPELHGTTLQDTAILLGQAATIEPRSTFGLEWLLGAKARFAEQLVAGVAGGSRFTTSIGAPDFRVLANFAWAPAPVRRATRPAPGPEAPAPPSDRDGDGVIDTIDACIDLRADTEDGCPLDTDLDGIYDIADRCPTERGERTYDERNGCPKKVDSDGDGFDDFVDACPQRPGVDSDDKYAKGCPPPPPPEPTDEGR